MREGAIEPTVVPRNPLDVLAQQVVAMSIDRTWPVEDLFDLVRGAENFAELGRDSFEATLGMLAGQYPADEFADLKPRIVWDRVAGTVDGPSRCPDGGGHVRWHHPRPGPLPGLPLR